MLRTRVGRVSCARGISASSELCLPGSVARSPRSLSPRRLVAASCSRAASIFSRNSAISTSSDFSRSVTSPNVIATWPRCIPSSARSRRATSDFLAPAAPTHSRVRPAQPLPAPVHSRLWARPRCNTWNSCPAILLHACCSAAATARTVFFLGSLLLEPAPPRANLPSTPLIVASPENCAAPPTHPTVRGVVSCACSRSLPPAAIRSVSSACTRSVLRGHAGSNALQLNRAVVRLGARLANLLIELVPLLHARGMLGVHRLNRRSLLARPALSAHRFVQRQPTVSASS